MGSLRRSHASATTFSPARPRKLLQTPDVMGYHEP